MFYFYKYKINVSSLKPFPCLHTLLSLTQPINHPHSPSYGYIYPKCHHSCAKGTWMPAHSLTFPPPAQGEPPCNSAMRCHRTAQAPAMSHLQIIDNLIFPLFYHSQCVQLQRALCLQHRTFPSCLSSAPLGQELNSPHAQLLILSSTYQLTTNTNISQKTERPIIYTAHISLCGSS